MPPIPPTQNTSQASDGTPLDPSALALTKSIGTVESNNTYTAKGKSGEYGRYQFTQPTWRQYAGKYLGNPDADVTDPVNQDKVAYYAVKAMKDSGLNPEQVVSTWNSGHKDAYLTGYHSINSYGVPYDTQAYTAKVINEYNKYKNAAMVSGAPSSNQSVNSPINSSANGLNPADQLSADRYGALFPSQTGEGPVAAGLKAVGNVPTSIYGLGKNLVNTVIHPIDTITGLGRAAIGGAENIDNALFGGTNPQDQNIQTANAVGKSFKDRFGGLENLQRTATNDPAGFGSDVLAALGLGAKVADFATGSLAGNAGDISSFIDRTSTTHSNLLNESGSLSAADSVLPTPISTMSGDTAAVQSAAQSNVGRAIQSMKDDILTNLSPQGYNANSEITKAISALDPNQFSSVQDFADAAKQAVTSGSPGFYSNALNQGIQKTADIGTTVAKPIIAPIQAAGRLAGRIGGSLLSHITGLGPDDIKTIFNNPEDFSRLQREASSRASLSEEFGDDLDKVFQAKSDTGAAYDTFRASKVPIQVPPDMIANALKKYGFDLDGENNVVATADSITRTPADINAIQNFVDNWGDKTELTPNQFLNMRSDIGKIAGFGEGKSSGATIFAKGYDGQGGLYADINDQLRPEITGLAEKDAEMAPQIKMIDQAKRDFLNPDGTFKDGAINKIANAGGVGKDNLLGRMEQISPGITDGIKVLKAAEGIERANGIKVGTYTRGILEGSAAITGNIPLLVGAIISSPESAVQIVRAAGYTGKAVAPIVAALRSLAGKSFGADIAPASTALKLSAFGQANQFRQANAQ